MSDYNLLIQLVPIQYWKRAFEFLRTHKEPCYVLGHFDFQTEFGKEVFEPDFSGQKNAGPTLSPATPGLHFLMEATGDERHPHYCIMSAIRYDSLGNPCTILQGEMRVDGVVDERNND